MTGSVKTRHNNAHCSKFHFYNIHEYFLAKFQLWILKSFEVKALQRRSNRKIDLYSKYRENKLQVLTLLLFTLAKTRSTSSPKELKWM